MITNAFHVTMQEALFLLHVTIVYGAVIALPKKLRKNKKKERNCTVTNARHKLQSTYRCILLELLIIFLEIQKI